MFNKSFMASWLSMLAKAVRFSSTAPANNSRLPRVRAKGTPQPAGSKLARKAKEGRIGVRS